MKVFLISQIPLPNHQIGSWSTIYDNYLRGADVKIDKIICPKPHNLHNQVSYSFYSSEVTNFTKIKRKLKWQGKFDLILKEIEHSIKGDEKYILQIIDNVWLAVDLLDFLEKKKIREQCYIQYYYHGYPPFTNELFLSRIDELILLTQKSYREMVNMASAVACRVSILHNGIDTSKFYLLSSLQKRILRNEFEIKDKIVFMWCSQDRPKKGLHIILDTWTSLYSKFNNIELWVIGTHKKQIIEGVKFFGRIPNNELPKYYQMADCYLFPTLCLEGFGMTLIEALHCGCYCIASDLGGVAEVLEYGKYGKLITNPHFKSEWELAISEFIEGHVSFTALAKDKFSTDTWNRELNEIISQAKLNFK